MKKNKPTHTRKLNPALGLFGLLGFLGFLGFIPEIVNQGSQIPLPLAFFAFFGFFGFYYEGKMSDTLIDERFELNANRASSIANRVALGIIWAVSIFSMSVLKPISAPALLGILISTIGIAIGMAVFLSQYLLYRFETRE